MGDVEDRDEHAAHAERVNTDDADVDADDEVPVDFGWGPLTFRGTCVVVAFVGLGVVAAVVVGYMLLGSGAIVPGPGAYDWGPNPTPDYIKWYVFFRPAAAIFALIVVFFTLVQVVMLREEEPLTRRYVFNFRAERRERGLIRAMLLGMLSALVPRR